MTEILHNTEWHKVVDELAGERDKVRIYDDVLMSLLSDIDGAHVLDYGSGPGVIAGRLQEVGADVKTYDIAAKARARCADVIGSKNVYRSRSDIPQESFDALLCNLVLCINPRAKVDQICRDLVRSARSNAKFFVGFCNPLIYDAKETRLDYRTPTGEPYSKSHKIHKRKKEGNYKIFDNHRPLRWYRKQYQEAGLTYVGTHFTERYQMNGRMIQDFVIYELKKS